jgi:hypothetical protein
MVSRMLMTVGLLACTGVAWADARWIEGTYRNPAEGYSIRIPRGLRGMTGDQAGPERGVRISLPSGATIVTYGEPNSAEYQNPEEGVRHELANEKCASPQNEISHAHVGRLDGAKGTLICGDRVIELMLAFRRKGGEPIYWLRLDTVRVHESEDDAILESIAASLKLIRWE